MTSVIIYDKGMNHRQLACTIHVQRRDGVSHTLWESSENSVTGASLSFSWFMNNDYKEESNFQNCSYLPFQENNSSYTKRFLPFLVRSVKFRWTVHFLKSAYKTWQWCMKSIVRGSSVSCFLPIPVVTITKLLFLYTGLWWNFKLNKRAVVTNNTFIVVIWLSLLSKYEGSIFLQTWSPFFQILNTYSHEKNLIVFWVCKKTSTASTLTTGMYVDWNMGWRTASYGSKKHKNLARGFKLCFLLKQDAPLL